MTKFALFGAGFIGTIHGNNIAAHPRAELEYVYDVNTKAAEQLAARHGAKVAANPEEIWTSEVEAVLIASSTNTHADLLSGAIKAKKAAYCEKPIDLDIERVKEVVQRASQSDVPILIGFSRRFDPNHLGVREAVQNGDIGKLEMMHLTSRGILESCRVINGAKCDMSFEIHGTKGAVKWNMERMNELQLQWRNDANPAEDGYLTLLSGPAHPFHRNFNPAWGLNLGYDDLKVIEAYNFLNAVASGQQGEPGFAEALAVAKVQQAIMRAWDSERWEVVEI